MKIDELEAAYLDQARFPLTTQGDLDFHDQCLIDAVNQDDIREWEANKDELAEHPKVKARLKEYLEKRTILDQIKAVKAAKNP